MLVVGCCVWRRCLQDVESLVVTMHAAFEESFVRAEDLWAAYLVPPGPAPVSVRTGACGGVQGLLFVACSVVVWSAPHNCTWASPG